MCIGGGGPVGGHAMLCGDAGMAPDDCAVGTCTDIGPLLYLPAGSVGVCV